MQGSEEDAAISDLPASCSDTDREGCGKGAGLARMRPHVEDGKAATNRPQKRRLPKQASSC